MLSPPVSSGALLLCPTVRELAPTEKMAADEVAFVKVEGLGRLPFSNIRRCATAPVLLAWCGAMSELCCPAQPC